jgi:hypothetical protein
VDRMRETSGDVEQFYSLHRCVNFERQRYVRCRADVCGEEKASVYLDHLLGTAHISLPFLDYLQQYHAGSWLEAATLASFPSTPRHQGRPAPFGSHEEGAGRVTFPHR